MTAMEVEPISFWFAVHCLNRLFAARSNTKFHTAVNILLPCTGWETG